jgi:hypothetical protein
MTTYPASKYVSGDAAVTDIVINSVATPFFGTRPTGFCKNRSFAVSKSYTSSCEQGVWGE